MAEIETRLFRYFVALAETKHFGRTASGLGISTPTLSNQIKKLETQLSARLVIRKGNTEIELTDVGNRFLARARTVLREATEAEAIARQAARGEIGRIAVGFMTIMALYGLIEEFVGGFQKLHPGIEVILRQAPTMDQIKSVLQRDLDFGLVRTPSRYPNSLRGFVVCRRPMVLALPREHPLARHERIHPSQLKSESFVNYAPELDVGFWKHIDVIGEAGNFTPKITARVKDAITVLASVSAGQGIAVVSEAFKNVQMPNVVYRDFSIEPPMAPTSFIYRSDESSPAALAFIKFMRKHALPEKQSGSG
jgi:DNA-binding transcriptional LysR family regulator